MGLVFNPFTGTFDFTGSSGGGGGTIAGTIATNQIAFGTALDTIGGSANLTYNGTTAIVTGAGSSVTLFRVAGSSDTNYPFEVLGGIPGSFGAINTIARMSIAYIDDIGFSGWNFELYRDTSRGTGTPEGQAYDFNTGGPVGQSFTFTPDGSSYLGLAFDTTNSMLSVGSTFDASVLATLRAANVLIGNGGALKSDTTTAHTALIQAYDVDGAAYSTFATLTNANTPTFVITPPSGGTVTVNATTLQQGGNAISLASTFTTSGANALTLTTTGSTNVTLPTSGTLLTTAGSGASLTFPGTLSIASGKVLTASNTLTFTGTDSTSFAFPSSSDTVVSLVATQTLTNKRITKRVVTASDATSITPNTDNADVTYQLNTQAAGTLTINADSGTPTNGQSWALKIKSTNIQTFSWNAIFVGGTVALPTVTTGSSKIDYFVFLYDSVTPKWDYTGTAMGF